MGVLSWIVAPWLEDQLSGAEPLARALFICLTAGLVWQFVLVVFLMQHELGTLRWSRLRDALWLRSPQVPKTGRVGAKTWWWAALFVFLTMVWSLVPRVPGPSTRDFADFLSNDSGKDFFQGAWGWWALLVVFGIFNTVIGEELLFRGVLSPCMKSVFGRRDWIANGVLFDGVSLAPAMEDTGQHRRRDLLGGLPGRAASKAVDGHHRALRADRLHLDRCPRARVEVATGTHFSHRRRLHEMPGSPFTRQRPQVRVLSRPPRSGAPLWAGLHLPTG